MSLTRKTKIEKILCEKPHLREHLFTRGFLMTDGECDENGYPFYGKWVHHFQGGYHFYVHPKQRFYCIERDAAVFFLIGHAYNPFRMQICERQILCDLADAAGDQRLSVVDELTGVFTLGWVENRELTLIADCASMQIAYYGLIGGHLYVSTHMQLIGDLCGLETSQYVRRLTAYRFYRYYGAYLPGDISAYDEVKRIVPNMALHFSDGQFRMERFYPRRELKPRKTEEEYAEGISVICDIMRRNMQLIAQKWERPAISMSGGMDSKGSLAAANGNYDKFQYFSYISMPGEIVDAEAAAKICGAIGVPHRVDRISDNDGDFADIEEFREILEHNFGNIGANNRNDVRKRVFYTSDTYCTFDIEAKSWVSEVGRANYYKKFGFQKMPARLTPRQMTTMYKLFVHDRKLVRDTDRIFAQYIQDTDFDSIFNYDASDMYLWEMRYGGWGGQVITCEHRFAFDITVPYNNRILMDTFLSLPLDKRITDQSHYDMIRRLNPVIDQTGITITNYNETRARMYKEKLYYLVNTHIPF